MNHTQVCKPNLMNHKLYLINHTEIHEPNLVNHTSNPMSREPSS